MHVEVNRKKEMGKKKKKEINVSTPTGSNRGGVEKKSTKERGDG